jgi:hypothetical protein
MRHINISHKEIILLISRRRAQLACVVIDPEERTKIDSFFFVIFKAPYINFGVVSGLLPRKYGNFGMISVM